MSQGYRAVACPCDQPGCRSGNLWPITYGQGTMSMEQAQTLARKLNAYEDSLAADPRGDFEKLEQRLEEDHNCLLERLQDSEELTELIETGSVTVEWEGLKFVLVLNVKIEEDK